MRYGVTDVPERDVWVSFTVFARVIIDDRDHIYSRADLYVLIGDYWWLYDTQLVSGA